MLNRRTVITAPIAAALGAPVIAASERPHRRSSADPMPIRFAVKDGMVQVDGATWTEKFTLLKELGFDGIELSSPNGPPLEEIRAAHEATGLPVHGVVNSIHWQTRLSDPDYAVRARGRRALAGAIRDAKAYGGSSVLLVPGRVAGEDENQMHVWERSIEEIRQVLPLAAELGVMILIENVWNGFCYEHDGPQDQSAQGFADYLDAIDSPWVGMYLDIGNHRKYGRPEAWIRTLGSRIVKLDVKDWGFEGGWAKIGSGDVDWPAVRKALAEIGFTGWATAEVGGGGRERLSEIHQRMQDTLRG